MYYIFFENDTQKNVYDFLLRDEIEEGFWSTVKFDRVPYVVAQTFVDKDDPGITFSRARMSFDFNNKEWAFENGYKISMINALTKVFPKVKPEHLRKMFEFSEYYVLTHPKDDNTSYRSAQVREANVDTRKVPADYKMKLKNDLVNWYKAYNITEYDLQQALKNHDNILMDKEVRRMLIRMSEILKKRKVNLRDN